MVQIFEGAHKDAMKSTLAIRAIIYENITSVFEQITDFIDEKFLTQVLHFLYEEQPYLYHVPKSTGLKPLRKVTSKHSLPHSSSVNKLNQKEQKPEGGNAT